MVNTPFQNTPPTECGSYLNEDCASIEIPPETGTILLVKVSEGMSWHPVRESIRFQTCSFMIMDSLLLGLVKGLNEVCKALDRKEALLAVIAEDCEDAKYKKLITVRTISINTLSVPLQGQQHSSPRG